MYHWTDSKIRVHAFYCMLGISLLQYVHSQAETVWPGLSTEQLLQELGQIQQFLLLYPPQGQQRSPVAPPPCFLSKLSEQALPSAGPGSALSYPMSVIQIRRGIGLTLSRPLPALRPQGNKACWAPAGSWSYSAVKTALVQPKPASLV